MTSFLSLLNSLNTTQFKDNLIMEHTSNKRSLLSKIKLCFVTKEQERMKGEKK